MGLKVVNVFLLIALSVCFLQTAFGKPKPRDSSVVEEQTVVPINNETPLNKEENTPKPKPITQENRIPPPGRIWCEFEEANEDAVCQEHCLPKGYSYGICVSHTCSCI